MKLTTLFEDTSHELRGMDVSVSGLSYDSRHVNPGDLFFCITGFETDGNKYAADAVSKGAAAICSAVAHPDLDVPQVIVPDDRKAMALAAARFYDYPARSMRMIGITGTNGKTTTTYMIKRMEEAAGRKVGLIGTIRNMIGSRELHAERTTPESADLQALLGVMKNEGCDSVVMEVSSHSLALDRSYGIEFDVGIFTNLTQDHLDFHHSFEAYLEAKELLFRQCRICVLNRDDPYEEQIARVSTGTVRTFGTAKDADYRALDIELHAEAVSYELFAPQGACSVHVPIPGMFTVHNSLGAAAAALECGITQQQVTAALKDMPHVDGRFELLDTRSGAFSIILDYAHTPDSMENTLKTVREFARGRVLTVFGCGGNRDRTKRPIMGEIGVRYSDIPIVTSDNPRFEDPDAIIADIEAGIPEDAYYVRITDRRAAIRRAIELAQPGDVIVLAGKGHETYQEVRGIKHDFNEKTVVREILDELGI